MKKISLWVICLLLLNSACVSSKSIEDNPSNKNVFRIVPKAFDDQGVLDPIVRVGLPGGVGQLLEDAGLPGRDRADRVGEVVDEVRPARIDDQQGREGKGQLA